MELDPRGDGIIQNYEAPNAKILSSTENLGGGACHASHKGI